MFFLTRTVRFLLIVTVVLLPLICRSDTWVTEQKVSVDRCASAWFIKRFVDADAQFVFFKQGTSPPEGARYGFFGAEYFNRGGDCTLTALIKGHKKQPSPALRKINEFANDAVNWRYGPQFFGNRLLTHIGDLRAAFTADATVFSRVFLTFDLLFLAHGGDRSEYLPAERPFLDAIELRLLAQLEGARTMERLNAAIAVGEVAKWRASDDNFTAWLNVHSAAREHESIPMLSAAAAALSGDASETPPEPITFLRQTIADGMQKPETSVLLRWLVMQNGFEDDGTKKMVSFQAKILNIPN